MKNVKLFSNVFSLAAISLAALFVGGSDLLAGDTNQMETAKLAPGWELQDLDGKTVRAADFAGKVVVLDFWATWCPPCRAEIPGLIALQKKYTAQGLAVVGVSVDEAGLKTVKAFAQKNGINYPVVLTDNKMVEAYGGIDGLPTTFIINRSGHIVKQHLGFTEQAEFEREVVPLLAQ
ncbi:MAG: TlpA disulfide reductase family protein [Verrucomicrobiae bacterium]|nr:TlpA disulfide reductase family protein [Verrucomicrobiae bacterium]